MIRTCITLLIFLSTTALANDYSAKVIYGEDNRLDMYQVQDPMMISLAHSTVALMRPSDLREEGAITHIADSPIGRAYGLCTDEPFYDQNSAAFCSGFLVAPDTMVTAGHCISSQSACSNTRFVFGFERGVAGIRATSVPSSNVYTCKTLIHSVQNSGGEDFAVVKLDRPVVNHEPLNLSPETAVPGTGLTVIGHPSGLPTKVSGGANVRRVLDQHLVANLDTYGGNSGSAVFNTETGAVEGILVRGERDYVYENGCRRSNRCADDGCRGEDVTLIKQVKPYLEQ
ncbi:MAG TPA: serine protease [Bdellovibrionales bacterium]|nr:peptidase [Pseudobdellovibrionaceae bacterium]HAG90908.1 serine protease [Bdellovibrionales bacterium]|tara:strand:+ start:138 stop:992 length:855 start_codon:yes stop_codon:yes gene_type:complete